MISMIFPVTYFDIDFAVELNPLLLLLLPLLLLSHANEVLF
jgi:hypothetical protein